MNLKSYINSKINRSDERSTNVIKNIIASFGIKGVSILVSLLLVPITIHYVNPTQYGIWLTLSSIIGWLSFFDIGFGNGMRNRFAEARATGDYDKAKAYVSTTYICISGIFTIVWILFFCINFFIDWSKILNAPEQMAKELSIVAVIVVSFFCLQMVLKLINTLLIADQKPAKSAFLDTLGQIFALLLIFILTKTTQGSLIYLALAFGFCPILVTLIFSFWFYSGKYANYKPNIRYFDKKIIGNVLNLGFRFFFIQIVAIIFFQTTNFLIAQTTNLQNVTLYNIVLKYFSVVTMAFSIILFPLWSAFTDAYVKQDLQWIRKITKNTTKIWGVSLIVTLFMVIISPYVYRLWVGKEIANQIPISLSICCAIYVSISNWNNIIANFLNGIGKITLQLYLAVISGVIYIPLALTLSRYWGVNGIIIAMCTIIIPGLILPIQCKKILTQKATGIYDK